MTNEKKEERKRKMNKQNNSYNAGSELTIPGKDMPQGKRVSASHHFHRIRNLTSRAGVLSIR
jgi:hypothetical protein